MSSVRHRADHFRRGPKKDLSRVSTRRAEQSIRGCQSYYYYFTCRRNKALIIYRYKKEEHTHTSKKAPLFEIMSSSSAASSSSPSSSSTPTDNQQRRPTTTQQQIAPPSTLAYAMGIIVVGASAGLTLYFKRSPDILGRMEQYAANQLARNPPKFGPPTRAEWEKMRPRP